MEVFDVEKMEEGPATPELPSDTDHEMIECGSSRSSDITLEWVAKLPSDAESAEEEPVSQDQSVGQARQALGLPVELDGSIRDDILELFSEPRLVPACVALGLRGGVSD